MKTKLFLPLAALVLALAATGCNKAGKLSEPSKTPLPTGPVELKLKWPQGEHIVQDLDLKSKSETTVPGQPQPLQQNTAMGQKYSMTVLKEDPDGSHVIEVEFMETRMSSDMNGRKMMEYDSAHKSAADSTNPVASIFGKIVGMKIKLYLNNSNDVDHVEGMDELLSHFSGAGVGTASLKSLFSENYFKQMMGSSRYLPNKAVAPGDSWPVQFEESVEPVGTIVMDFNFTLVDWEKHGKRNCARMDLTGTIKSKAGTGSATGPMGMTIDIKDGNVSGTSWFDPELGIVIDSTVSQDMTLSITLPKNPKAKSGPASQPQNLSTHMNQDIRIKLDTLE
jgi:hypothetical protein